MVLYKTSDDLYVKVCTKNQFYSFIKIIFKKTLFNQVCRQWQDYTVKFWYEHYSPLIFQFFEREKNVSSSKRGPCLCGDLSLQGTFNIAPFRLN